MDILKPIAVADADFADTADFIIIGLGAAGASAAVDAAVAGIDVLVIERASGGGGSTAAAGGYIYVGGGSDAQKANGFEDTVENMIAYLTCEMPDAPHDKIRAYCEDSLDHYEWLKGHGVPFNLKYYAGKHFEVPSDETLSYTGNEKAYPFNQVAKPVPRGHMVASAGAAGHVLASKLIASAEKANARFEYDANVTALVTDENGRVVGVRFRREGKENFVRARHGVLIATGGFAMNPEMTAEFTPVMNREDVHIVGGPYADGAGIRLGVGVGAAVAHMDAQLVTSPIYPPEGYIKGVLVNKLGKRFIAEDGYHARVAEAILHQPDQTAYLIVDNAMYAPPSIGQQQVIDVWDDFAKMEAELGLPSGALQETIATYNRDAANGEDTDQHKYREWCQPIVDLPYAAIDCSLGKAFYAAFTLGGLRTDIDARVLREDGTPVAGLYAAGATASNLAQSSLAYSSGVCIGESTYFGRRAAAVAARERTEALVKQ